MTPSEHDMHIMINLPQILIWPIYKTSQLVSVLNLNSTKQGHRRKKLENFLLWENGLADIPLPADIANQELNF